VIVENTAMSLVLERERVAALTGLSLLVFAMGLAEKPPL
jgi:hypothetical protein